MEDEAGASGRRAGASTAGQAFINLLGLRVDAVDLDGATTRILEAVTAGRRGYVCLRDVHGVVRAQSDHALRRIHNRSFLTTPDGMPLVWALWLAGHRRADRVYGPDLMLALFDRGRSQGLRHFLYGATPETLSRLARRLTDRFPGATIVGVHAPPFRALSAAEEAQTAALVNATRPDLVWVGLGTPKQERWMARMRPLLDAGMLLGVGAAFDFHAGLKPQAPRWMQRGGLEWLFRLASEPRRLAGRYAVAAPSFVALAAAQAIGLRRVAIDVDAPDAGGGAAAAPDGR